MCIITIHSIMDYKMHIFRPLLVMQKRLQRVEKLSMLFFGSFLQREKDQRFLQSFLPNVLFMDSFSICWRSSIVYSNFYYLRVFCFSENERVIYIWLIASPLQFLFSFTIRQWNPSSIYNIIIMIGIFGVKSANINSLMYSINRSGSFYIKIGLSPIICHQR